MTDWHGEMDVNIMVGGDWGVPSEMSGVKNKKTQKKQGSLSHKKEKRNGRRLIVNRYKSL